MNVMDKTFTILKDWSFPQAFGGEYQRRLLERLSNHLESGHETEHTHYNPVDEKHYQKRLNERFKPDQRMPNGFERFTPSEVSVAMAEGLIEQHPELKHIMQRPKAAPDPNLPPAPPALAFTALHTDEPLHDSEYGAMTDFAPVFVTGHGGKVGHKTAIGGLRGFGASGRQTIKVAPSTGMAAYPNNSRIDNRLSAQFNFDAAPEQPGAEPVNVKSTQSINQGIINQIDDWSDIDQHPPKTFGRRTVGGPVREGGVSLNTYYPRAAKRMLDNIKDVSGYNVEAIRARDRRIAESAKRREDERARSDANIESQMSFNNSPVVSDFTNTMFNPDGSLKGEPMDLAWSLLKHAISPEAIAHKRKYDTDYESNPKRVNYRESLNNERRKRGIYGKGGPDMSHTKEHTLVAESPHDNRARHFKNRGTLK